MKSLRNLFVLLSLLPIFALAQEPGADRVVRGGVPMQKPRLPFEYIDVQDINIRGTCTGCGTTVTFGNLTGGTNTSAAMVVGSGASLAPAGTGTVTANAVSGNVQAPQLVSSGLIAKYDFSEGSGRTLNDTSGANACSGGPCNATWSAGANEPTWVSGTGCLNFPGSWNDTLNFPAALNNVIKTWVVFANMNNYTTINKYPMIIGHIDNNGGVRLTLGGIGMGSSSNSNVGTLPQAVLNYHAHGGNFGAAGKVQTVYIGGSYESYAVSFSGDGVTNDVTEYANGKLIAGPTTTSGPITTNNYFLGQWSLATDLETVGTECFIAGYNRILTAQEVAKNDSFLRQQATNRGIVLSNPKTYAQISPLLILGDSISLPAGSWPASLTPTDSYTQEFISNQGYLLSSDIVRLLPQASGVCSGVANRCVAIVFAGTNDVCGPTAVGQTAAQTAMFQTVHQLKANGWLNVLIFTMLDRNNVSVADCDTNQKNLWNNFLRNNWQAIGATALVDIAANPLLGADGAYSNATYFADGIHPATAGYTLIATMATAALDSLDGGNMAGAPVSPTNTYQMLPSDYYVYPDTTINNFTITLPECQGKTGQIYNIMNKKAGAAHTLTVSGLSASETIETTAAVAQTTTLADGASLQLRVQLISAAAGGCTWKKIN